MSQENVEIVREAMDAYNLGDKDEWAQCMDPELETFPVPEFPKPGSLIGPDAAWEFYERFGETMAGSKLYETAEVETAELIDAGERVFACQRTALQGRGSVEEIEFKLWGVHTFDQGRWLRTPWFLERGERPSQQQVCRSSALDCMKKGPPPVTRLPCSPPNEHRGGPARHVALPERRVLRRRCHRSALTRQPLQGLDRARLAALLRWHVTGRSTCPVHSVRALRGGLWGRRCSTR